MLAKSAAVTAYLPWCAGHRGRRILATVLSAVSMATFAIGARMALYLLADPLQKAWVSYFPYRVVSRSEDKGMYEVVGTLVVAIGFVVIRSVQIWQSPATVLVAPREPLDDRITSDQSPERVPEHS